jgi:hypothetical protein
LHQEQLALWDLQDVRTGKGFLACRVLTWQ